MENNSKTIHAGYFFASQMVFSKYQKLCIAYICTFAIICSNSIIIYQSSVQRDQNKIDSNQRKLDSDYIFFVRKFLINFFLYFIFNYSNYQLFATQIVVTFWKWTTITSFTCSSRKCSDNSATHEFAIRKWLYNLQSFGGSNIYNKYVSSHV